MNEAAPASEKLPAEKGTPPAPKKNVVAEYFAKLHGDGKLTRVPVSHLYFPPGEYMDFSGSNSSTQMSNVACLRPGEKNTSHWVCDFIPAWQMFELSFVPGGDAMPITELVGVAHVKRWKR